MFLFRFHDFISDSHIYVKTTKLIRYQNVPDSSRTPEKSPSKVNLA